MAAPSANLMLNSDVCLTGNNLLLVPYLKHHVLRYHDWLLREDILEATCSEPQSLEEEYENQISWMEADDKMTFIVLAPLSAVVPSEDDRKALVESAAEGKDVFGNPLAPIAAAAAAAGAPSPLVSSTSSASAVAYNPFVMIGDCNLFKMPIHHTEEGEIEVSVMLAENRFRGKGLARETVGLLMCYAYEHLKRSSFVAKILASNEDSRNLFEKGSLGFSLLKEVKAFDEIHYIKRLVPALNPEDGSLVAAAADSAADSAAEDTAADAQSKKPLIKSISDLMASVGYAKHAYTPETCEHGRTMALTNDSEKAFY